jgi:hypothetical protein
VCQRPGLLMPSADASRFGSVPGAQRSQAETRICDAIAITDENAVPFGVHCKHMTRVAGYAR